MDFKGFHGTKLNGVDNYSKDIEEINHNLRLTILNLKVQESHYENQLKKDHTICHTPSIFTDTMIINIQNGLLILREPHNFTLTYTFNPDVLTSMLHDISFIESDQHRFVCPLKLLKIVFERPLGTSVELFPLPTIFDEKHIVKVINDRIESLYHSYNNRKEIINSDDMSERSLIQSKASQKWKERKMKWL